MRFAGGWRTLRLRPLLFTVFAMTTVIGAVAIAFSVAALSAERLFLERERDDAVAERGILQEAFANEGRQGLVIRMERRGRLAAPEAHYGLFDTAGKWVGGDLRALPVPRPTGDWSKARSITPAGTPITVNASSARLADGSTLVVGRDAAGQREFERRIADGLVVALAIVVAASLGVGLVLNALLIQRAQAVAGVAERIANGEFGARAEVSPRGDSFDRIGSSLNVMLDRVDELMTGMRAVTDSLAHDLRTPLTHVRGAVERALDPESTEQDCRAALEVARNEVEQVLAVFTSLIDIARAESGLSREMMQPIRLNELAADMTDLFAPLLEDAGQSLQLGRVDALTIEGHESLLRQAIGNLFFNATKYAGAGARVTLEVRGEGDLVELIVADDGPGIAETDRVRVKDRFVRLDAARTGAGFGLGLSIVAAAAKLHGGELLLQDNGPGLRAVLRMGAGRPRGGHGAQIADAPAGSVFAA